MAKKNVAAKAKKATTTTRTKLARAGSVLTDEAGNRLTITASELKDGTFRSAVVYRPAGAKSQRAMTEVHPTFAEASERAASLTSDAVSEGWAAKVKKGKAPAFSEIPRPSTK